MKYIREDDGAVMVEMKPNCFINEKVAIALGMTRRPDVPVAVCEKVDIRTSPPRKRAPTGSIETVKRGTKETSPRARKSKSVSKGRTGSGTTRKRVLTPRKK